MACGGSGENSGLDLVGRGMWIIFFFGGVFFVRGFFYSFLVYGVWGSVFLESCGFRVDVNFSLGFV